MAWQDVDRLPSTGQDRRPQETQGEAILEEALDRLQEARHQKVVVEVLMREGYWFAAPERHRSVFSTFKPPTVPPQDAEVLSTGFAFEVCGDFPTVIINTFFPESGGWAERRAGLLVPDQQVPSLEEKAKLGDDKIFEAIGASNFYAECGKGFNPDLAQGTVAIWIEPGKRPGTFYCQAVPIRELEINLGPDGEIDDRFVVRWTKFRHLSKVLPDRTLTQRIANETAKDKNGDCCVIRGFWKEGWEGGEEKWCYVELVDKELIHHHTIMGRGAIPLIVARFNASPEWAWGCGPLRQALPDFRTLDELSRKKIISIDLHLMPPTGYPSDSISHLESGLEAGMLYPVRPGSEGAIKNIYDPPPPDPAIYYMQDLETRIKRLFFLDWPKQTGDTPPTATQWLDEMTMAQRRIGTPGFVFWAEWCAGVFQRFEYMLERSGIIEPLRLKDGKQIALMPYNPAQRAAEQQDVAQFTRFIQIAGMAAPEETKMAFDWTKTLKKLRAKMGVGDLVVDRNPAELQAMIRDITALQAGQPPNAPSAGEGQAAETAPQQELAGPAAPQASWTFQSRNIGSNA